jgi:hypothetical protein
LYKKPQKILLLVKFYSGGYNASPLYQLSSQTSSAMVNIDATTPQLQVLKKFIEANSTLNMDNTERFYAKDFKMQTFPKSDETPELTKEGYLQKQRAMVGGVAKAEVRIHLRRPSNYVG